MRHTRCGVLRCRCHCRCPMNCFWCRGVCVSISWATTSHSGCRSMRAVPLTLLLLADVACRSDGGGRDTVAAARIAGVRPHRKEDEALLLEHLQLWRETAPLRRVRWARMVKSRLLVARCAPVADYCFVQTVHRESRGCEVGVPQYDHTFSVLAAALSRE